MHIGFLSPHDPRDRRSFSGTAYYMYSALEKRPGVRLSIIGEKVHRRGNSLRRIFAVGERLSGGRVKLSETVRRYTIRELVKEAQKCLQGGGTQDRPDIVIAPVASDILGDMAVSEACPPIIFVTDATHSFIRDFYRWPVSEDHARRERQAVQKASVVIYSSEFMALRAAQEFSDGGSDLQGKISHVPFGLNMDRVGKDCAEVPTSSEYPLNLIFVGRDWQRKGGDIALATAKELRERLDARVNLTIVGCAPAEVQGIDWIEVYPYLNKNNPAQQQVYFDLLRNSHFLLLPTRADCTPMVIAEANAMGVPAVTSNVGGIPSLVKHGVTGIMLNEAAGCSDYAVAIERAIASLRDYQALSDSARKHYQDYLNWDAWAERVLATVRPLLDKAEG